MSYMPPQENSKKILIQPLSRKNNYLYLSTIVFSVLCSPATLNIKRDELRPYTEKRFHYLIITYVESFATNNSYHWKSSFRFIIIIIPQGTWLWDKISFRCIVLVGVGDRWFWWGTGLHKGHLNLICLATERRWFLQAPGPLHNLLPLLVQARYLNICL